MNDSSFSHADVFPIIRRIIREVHRERPSETHDFVTHREIVDALLHDEAGQREVRMAQRVQCNVPKEKIAANMVAFFSKTITQGDPHGDLEEFERKEIEKRWAYRTRQTGARQ